MIESNVVLIESVGTWPEHALEDINNALVKLIYLDHCDLNENPPKTYASEHTFKGLDCQFFRTDVTYRMYFKNNNITEFVMDKTLEDDMVLVVLNNDCIQINGIGFNFIKNCAFCPNEIRLHHQAVKLIGERLVCDKCYARVFDTVLHGLQGSANDE